MSTTFSRGENPLKADKLNQAFSERVNRSGDTMAGSLTLSGDPTNAFHAATKQYVDTKAGSIQVTGGVTTFNTRNGDVVLSLTDVTTALTFTPYNATNPSGYQTAANVTTTLVPYAKLASPIFTGDARAVTAAPGDNDTSIATTAFVQTAVTSAPALNTGGRNLLHNPLFNVAQRGTTAFSVSGYTLDRWRMDFALDTMQVQQIANDDTHRTQIGDEAASYLMFVNVTGNAGAGAFSVVSQYVEDVRRLAGKTVTVSFWAYTTAGTPKIGVAAQQVFGTGGSPSAAVAINGTPVTLSTTATRYSATFAYPSTIGKTVGTNGDSSSRLALFFSSGTTNNAFAGGIGVQSGTFLLWGMQLEIGSVATPLEKPDPATDWSNCQRFYQTGPFYNSGYGAAGVGVGIHLNFPVTMRTIPTVIPTYTNQSNCSSSAASGPSVNGFIPYTIVTATSSYALQGTYTASADL